MHKLGGFRGLLAVAAGLLLAGPPALAIEGGGGAYPNGAENFFAGAVPPPGTYFIDYAAYYRARKFRDGNGNSAIPDFRLDVWANAFRFLHVSNVQLFGGNYAVHAVIPVLRAEVSVPGASQTKEGVGDIIVDPFAITWHWKNLHAVAGLEIYIPVGSYRKTDLVNLSRNYWTVGPMLAVTYISDGGFESSIRLEYDINSRNSATNYRSGQALNVDYLFAQAFGNFSIGIGGYYHKQLTDDKIGGVKVGPDGFRGQVFAWGPAARYQLGKVSFVGAIQKESHVRNRPDGEKYWLRFYVPF